MWRVRVTPNMPMNCHRCDYEIGLFQTRCKVCGERASRLRIATVCAICLGLGVFVGYASIHLLKL